MVITDDGELALAIRKAGGLGYSSLGLKKARISKEDIQHPSFTRHDYMGWNYRMPELCCAVALAQVERMDELVDVRVHAAKALDVVVFNGAIEDVDIVKYEQKLIDVAVDRVNALRENASASSLNQRRAPTPHIDHLRLRRASGHAAARCGS